MKKWICICFFIACLAGCNRSSEPEKAYEAYLQNFKKNDFNAMWKVLSTEQQTKIQNDLVLLKAGKGMAISTRGLLEVSPEDLAKMSGESYFCHLMASYKKILEKKKDKKLFDASTAHVEKASIREKTAVVHLFDGRNHRRVKMVEEQGQWKVEEEYSADEDKKSEES